MTEPKSGSVAKASESFTSPVRARACDGRLFLEGGAHIDIHIAVAGLIAIEEDGCVAYNIYVHIRSEVSELSA